LELNWFESLLFGLFSGLADILPVSSKAHQLLMMKFFGIKSLSGLLPLLVHISIFAALYSSSHGHIVRIARALRLARIPKRKRKRPLDIRSMMDWRLLQTMIIPVVLSIFVYKYTVSLGDKLIWIALFLFINGIILYAPQFLPTGNRDSRTLSRVEGLLMGLGGSCFIFPGISAVGVATSVGSVCGVERTYALDMTLMMNMAVNIGLIVLDILNLIAVGFGTISIMMFLRYLFAAVISYVAAMGSIRLMRTLAKSAGFSVFAFYCWGVALFAFIMNLMA